MKKVYGISLSISSLERSLWFDHDEKRYQPEGWGVKFHLMLGRLIRPVPRLWKPYNKWNTWIDPWFVIRIPVFILPFISVALGPVGFYFGGKVFLCKSENKYDNWLKPEEKGTNIDPAEYMTLSATIRTTRWN